MGELAQLKTASSTWFRDTHLSSAIRRARIDGPVWRSFFYVINQIITVITRYVNFNEVECSGDTDSKL